MKLHELLKYNDIVIQCHDNPDADALASGYALWWYFTKMGKSPNFIYRGRSEIQKSNLKIMMERLDVPVSYEPDYMMLPELLVTVDCQYGQRNVTRTEAETVAVIDHHQVTGELPELSEVRSGMGSCSTIIWDMIREEGLSVDEDRNLSTALYYGLFTDTNRLSEVSHPLDRDMRDSLQVSRSVITEMSNSNISLEELTITGNAITGYEYHEDNRYVILRTEPCDPNILGVISDFVMETEGIDASLAYYVSPFEVKLSVRSCVKEVHADELAAFLTDGIGGGGGHILKAGGSIRPDRMEELALPGEDIFALADRVLMERMETYFSLYEVMYAKDTTLSPEGLRLYEKQPQELGCAKLTDLFPLGTSVAIRTLEGDVDVVIKEDLYLMIGIEGEVYPIREEKLRKSYTMTGKPYSRVFDYDPSVTDTTTKERKNVMECARGVISSGGSRILAKPLNRYVKLFTAWDEEKYYSGNPGDYIACREDDPHDIYIIRNRLFDKLYKEIV
ncbi:MAG: DHH family phosphoesterase [Eubacterium sp.]|nr:DHH family phosphoesterase [Eubacterium sp.]